jgi:hypothetical protein
MRPAAAVPFGSRQVSPADRAAGSNFAQKHCNIALDRQNREPHANGRRGQVGESQDHLAVYKDQGEVPN